MSNITEITRRFNSLYKEIFPEPAPLLTEFPKVVGVDGRKMSKSYDNAIYLSDTPQVVEQKIRTMVTDPARVKKTDPGDPELSPVYQLHKMFSSKEEVEKVADGCRTAGIGCIECKKILIRNVFRVMEPIWAKRQELLNNHGYSARNFGAGDCKGKKGSGGNHATCPRSNRVFLDNRYVRHRY